jgi:uncharacterized MnhB-related membrane protein
MNLIIGTVLVWCRIPWVPSQGVLSIVALAWFILLELGDVALAST